MVILHRLTNTSAALKTWKRAPLFYLLFVFTIMHGSRRAVRNGEVLISFTTSGHKVDVRGRGWYSNMYAWNQVLTGHDSTTLMSGLQDCGRVLEGIIQWVTSVVEPLSPHPVCVHLTSFTWWMRPGLPCFTLLSTIVNVNCSSLQEEECCCDQKFVVLVAQMNSWNVSHAGVSRNGSI